MEYEVQFHSLKKKVAYNKSRIDKGYVVHTHIFSSINKKGIILIKWKRMQLKVIIVKKILDMHIFVCTDDM